jgi:hypothetical protein
MDIVQGNILKKIAEGYGATPRQISSTSSASMRSKNSIV